jgi:hypothetical protein
MLRQFPWAHSYGHFLESSLTMICSSINLVNNNKLLLLMRFIAFLQHFVQSPTVWLAI